MKKRNRVIAVLLCASMLVCGCAANSQPEETSQPEQTQQVEEKEYQKKLDLIKPFAYNNADGLDLEAGSYISIIGKADTGEYWEQVKEGVAQAAADINENLGLEGNDRVKVTFSGPSTADDVDEQVNILDEELSRYPVALGISVVDMNACEVQFDLAAEGDIPVVAFDSGSDYQGLMATIATDNNKAAREAAAHLAEEMGGAGEVIAFVHDGKSKAALDREAGFKAEIEENHGGVSIVETYHLDQIEELQQQIVEEIQAGTYQLDGEVEGQQAETDENQQNAAEQDITVEDITEEQVIDYVLSKHPNVTGVFGSNANAIRTALESLERNEKTGVSVVGFDADEDELEAVKDGRIAGVIVQNPFGMGYATVVAAARAALNLGNEAVVDTGYTWVTKDNIETEEVEKILY